MKKQVLCDVAKVASMFNVSPSTIWNWAGSGLIPQPQRFGNKSLWDEAELKKAADKVTFFKPKMVKEKTLDETGKVKSGLAVVPKVTIQNLPTVTLYPEGGK